MDEQERRTKREREGVGQRQELKSGESRRIWRRKKRDKSKKMSCERDRIYNSSKKEITVVYINERV